MQLYFPVSNVLESIQKTLRDVWGVQFDPSTELLPHLNDACSMIVNKDDQALVKNIAFRLEPFTIDRDTGIVTAGTLYAQGNTITLAGGTFTQAAILQVSGVNETTGAVNMVAIQNYGSYTAYPSNPVSQGSTSGSGTGATFSLTKLGPKQELPPDAASLIDIAGNLGVDGQTQGGIITKVPKDIMDAVRPGWRQDICGVSGQPTQPIHYVFDERDAKRFYLWPYVNVMSSPWYVEMKYRAVPNNVGIDDAFPLPALYEPVAKFYTIAHAMMRLDEDDKRWAKCQTLIPMFMKEFNDALVSTNLSIKMTVPDDRPNSR
jgi:hypothetical protein